jgi:hypothetical protein
MPSVAVRGVWLVNRHSGDGFWGMAGTWGAPSPSACCEGKRFPEGVVTRVDDPGRRSVE